MQKCLQVMKEKKKGQLQILHIVEIPSNIVLEVWSAQIKENKLKLDNCQLDN